MKHLKYFKTEAEYTQFKNTENFVLPNVSYIEETKDVCYAPFIEPPFNMVDLGLPSGRLWCDRNIGAASPEDVGLVFQWGDTVGYTIDQVMNGEKRFASDYSDYFDKSFVKYNQNKRTLSTKDDAANVHMGTEYRMPTEAEFEELINNTTAYKVSIDGEEVSPEWGVELIKGVKLVGLNGNSIYIPSNFGVSGDDSWTQDVRPDTVTRYSTSNLWTSTGDEYNSAWARHFTADKTLSKYPNTSSSDKYLGFPVRGVK